MLPSKDKQGFKQVVFYLTKKDVSANSCLLAKDKLWNNLQKGRDFRKFCLTLDWGDARTSAWPVITDGLMWSTWANCWGLILQLRLHLGSSSRNGHGHPTSVGHCRVAAAQILWFKCSWVDKGQHEWRLGSRCFFCRALTNMDDSFLPMLSREELKQESKWYSVFELLEFFYFFFPSPLMGPDTEGKKCSSPCNTSWQWTWNKLMTALAKKDEVGTWDWQNHLFQSQAATPLGLKGGKRGDTPKRCSIPLRCALSFLPIPDKE